MKKRTVIALVLVAVIVATAMIIWALHANVVRLPDGTQISLEGATMRQPFYFAEGWKKPVVRAFPAIGRKLMVFPFPSNYGSNCVTAWTYRTHPPTTDFSSSLDKTFRKVVFHDEDGNEYPRPGKIYFQEYRNGSVEGSVMPLVSRPGESVAMTMTARSLDRTTNYTATLNFRAPQFPFTTNFTVSPFPIKSDDTHPGYELVDISAAKFAEATADERWTRAILRTTNHTDTTTTWEIASVLISDEFGNVHVPKCHRASGTGPELTVWFEGAYSPKTPRKFRFYIAARPKTVSTNVTWTLTNIPLRGDPLKKFRAIRRSKGFDGETIFFGYHDDGLFGPDKGFIIVHEKWRTTNGDPTDGIISYDHFDVLGAYDDQQRPLTLEPWTERENVDVFRCNFPDDSKTATLLLAAHRSFVVDFIAAPTATKEN